MSSSLLFLQHFELLFSHHHTTHSEFLLKTRTANPLYVLDFPLSQLNLNLYDVDVSRPLLPSKTYYLTPDVSPLLHLKIEMANDHVFPSFAPCKRRVSAVLMAHCLSSKTSNYIINVFWLLFSKPTEVNAMFSLFRKLLHDALYVLLYPPPLFF
jgi:hypothetical protein